MSMWFPTRVGQRRLWTSNAVVNAEEFSAIIEVANPKAEDRQPSQAVLFHLEAANAGSTDDLDVKIYPVFRKLNATLVAADRDTAPIVDLRIPIGTENEDPARRTFLVTWEDVGDACQLSVEVTGNTDTITVDLWVSFYQLSTAR